MTTGQYLIPVTTEPPKQPAAELQYRDARDERTRWLIECAKDAVSTGDMTKEEAMAFLNERLP